MDLDRTLLEIGGSPVTLLHLLLVAALFALLLLIAAVILSWRAQASRQSEGIAAQRRAAGEKHAVVHRTRMMPKRVDELLEKALATVNDAEREKLLFQASELAIGTDAGIVPLYYQVNTWATRKGVTYSARQDEYSLAQFVRPGN